MDVVVKISNVFVVIAKKEEVLELVAVPSDVISKLMAHKVMSSSIIMVLLIQNATEEAITIRLHVQNVASVGEV
jgi:hypothetical protein